MTASSRRCTPYYFFVLYASDQREPLLARFAADEVRGFTARKLARLRADDGPPARLLVDDRQAPRVLLILNGASVNAVGELQALNGAFADLLAGKVDCADGWPWPELAADWERSEGRRYLFFNATSLASWRAARIAGFVTAPAEFDGDNEFVAYQWTWQGAPRHSELVRHPCRMVEQGEELLEQIKQGVPYDPAGHYAGLCLRNGPSFVCEIPAEAGVPAGDHAQPGAEACPTVIPVAWACTHLTGFMGMLYTPPEHRRQGYARSLWAFQIDAMLEREGIAACHVIDSNSPSMGLMHGLGGTPLYEPIVWRTLYWPGARAEQG